MAGNVDAGWTLLTVREDVQRFPSYLPCPVCHLPSIHLLPVPETHKPHWLAVGVLALCGRDEL